MSNEQELEHNNEPAEEIIPSRGHYYILGALVLVLLDQATKVAVKGFSIFGWEHRGMYLGESFPLIGDIVRITFVENPGMAFGITFGWGKIFLSMFSIAATIALGWYMLRGSVRHPLGYGTLMLILAGAAGNMIDRVFYGVLYGTDPLFFGKVVDFIDVDIFDIAIFGFTLQRWYIFNIADACVTCGMVLLFFAYKHIPFLAEKPVMEASVAPVEAEITPEQQNDDGAEHKK